MPVAGLPAAVEALLTSLITTEVLSSWKVAGEDGNNTVVLRFKPASGQPCQYKRGTWHRKTPSRLRRDMRRSERHRANGEQQHLRTRSFANGIMDSDSKFDEIHECARESRDARATGQTPTTTVTFDLPDHQPILTKATCGHLETCETEPNGKIPTSSATPSAVIPPATEQDLSEEDSEDMSQRLMEQLMEKMPDFQDSMRLLREARESIAVCSAPQPDVEKDTGQRTQESTSASSSTSVRLPASPETSHAQQTSPSVDTVLVSDRRQTSRHRTGDCHAADRLHGKSVQAAAENQTARTSRTLRK